MALEELNQSDNSVAESVESIPQEATETTSEATPVEKVEEPKVDFSKPVTSSTEAHKVLKAQKELQSKPKAEVKPQTDNLDYKKQYEEMQKLVGKNSRELNELRKFQQEYQAEKKAIKEQQEQLEWQKLAQQNPQEAYREMARREALALQAPMQETLSLVQAQSVDTQLRNNLGEKYSQYAPVMSEIIDEFEKIDAYNANNPDPAQRTRYAQEISANANVLIDLANKKFAEINKTKAGNISEQRKSDNLRLASGVAKKSNVKSEAVDDFSKLSLEEMNQRMKQLGLIKK